MPTLAPPPTRSTVGFTLQWGLVPVKIRLFTATEDKNPMKRSLYTTDGHKVIQPKIDSSTMKPVSGDEIVAMVEVDGKLVELTDEEMGEITSDYTVDRNSVEIQFVPLASIGTRYRVDKSYQARAGKIQTGKRSVEDPQAQKTLALFLQSMAKRKVACLFRASLKGPARYAALTPDGDVHFLFYDGEVRQQVEWPDVKLTKKDLDMGLTLIDPDDIVEPDLDDERAEALLAYVTKKVNDGKGIEPRQADGEPVAQVVDLTAALEASIAAQAKAPKRKVSERKAS